MTRRRSLRKQDEAVTEVIGYILTFALSAVILLISVQSFNIARNNSDAVVTAVELKAIANRVSQRIIEAGQISQEFPNASFNIGLVIPADLNGHVYYIETNATTVVAVAVDGTSFSESSNFRLEALSDIASVTGKVYSSNEHITISYAREGGIKTIRIE